MHQGLNLTRKEPVRLVRERAILLRQLASLQAGMGNADAKHTVQRALKAIRAAFGDDAPTTKESEPVLHRILETRP